MMKYSILACVIVSLLASCTALTKKPQPASLFATPLGETFLTVKIPVRSADAILFLSARNQGVETWQTGDAVSVSLRDGVIVATRGLGFDVMGSDVSQTLAALRGARSGQYQVQRSYLTADNHPEQITATCKMSRAASDGHFIEDCTAVTGEFRNEYWLNGSGNVAVSVQWIGPQVQYLNLGYAVVG